MILPLSFNWKIIFYKYWYGKHIKINEAYFFRIEVNSEEKHFFSQKQYSSFCLKLNICISRITCCLSCRTLYLTNLAWFVFLLVSNRFLIIHIWRRFSRVRLRILFGLWNESNSTYFLNCLIYHYNTTTRYDLVLT